MKKFVIFGAGDYGQRTLNILGIDNVAFFIDNDNNKIGTDKNNIPIRGFDECINDLYKYNIVIAVSNKYVYEIKAQLQKNNIKVYDDFLSIQKRITKKNILSRTDYIDIYNKAILWITCNTIDYQYGKAIINSDIAPYGYPEVTGYYIPSLLRWGYRDLATNYAKWLLSIQKENGSWFDTYDKIPYVFDTAQILKGLLAIKNNNICLDVDRSIIKACEWLISYIQPSGKFIAADEKIWNNTKGCSELIHLYCLSPIKEAGVLYNRTDFIEAVNLSLNYYKNNKYNEITEFHLLSHFYAYVIEALIDLGEFEMAKIAMAKIEKLQTADGAVPAYNDVKWVCSTGLFQFALVWYRLGNIKCGNKAFKYACSLQNRSGGWYGSYITDIDSNEENDYFGACEISWAVKYFLDALYYKNVAEHNLSAPFFKDYIENTDQRYLEIKNIVLKKIMSNNNKINVLDAGCGKARYLANILNDVDNDKISLYAIDISANVLLENAEKFNDIEFSIGSLTNIPYGNDYFDIIYTCEALEHAVDIDSAIKEMARVVKSQGYIAIIDKNISTLGALEISDCEQWFDEEKIKEIMKKYCNNVEIIHDIPYEDHCIKNLFSMWIGVVR